MQRNQTKFQTPILARSRYINKFYGQISIVYATISFYGIYFIKIKGLRWHLEPILYSSFSFSKLVKIVQSLLLREFGDLVGVSGQFDPRELPKVDQIELLCLFVYLFIHSYITIPVPPPSSPPAPHLTSTSPINRSSIWLVIDNRLTNTKHKKDLTWCWWLQRKNRSHVRNVGFLCELVPPCLKGNKWDLNH